MRRALAILSMLSLTACATTGVPGARPLTYQTPGDTQVLVSYNSCPNTPVASKNFAPIVAALLTGAASKLIENFGESLNKGAEGGALPASVALTNFEIPLDNIPQCLVIIRGKLSKPDRKNLTDYPVPKGNSGDQEKKPLSYYGIKPGQTSAGGNDFFGYNLPMSSDIQHYIELQIIQSQDKTVLTFAPVMVWIAKSMDGDSSGDRQLSISVKFNKPGSDPTGSAVLLGSVKIGEKTDYQLGENGRFAFEAPWFSGLTAPKGSDDGSTAPQKLAKPNGKNPGAPPEQAPGKVGKTTPNEGNPSKGGNQVEFSSAYTVTTTVVETRPTKEFLAFVAGVFGAAKPVIENAVKTAVDPDVAKAKAAAVQTAAVAALDAQGVYAETLGKAYAAQVQYCAMDASKIAELYTASGELRKLQLNANKAAASVNVLPPFTTLTTVTGENPATLPICKAG